MTVRHDKAGDTDAGGKSTSGHAAQAVDEALGAIRSVQDAEKVLDDLEASHAGVTQSDAEATPPEPGLTALETVAHAVEEAGEREQPAVALATAVEQAAGPPQLGSDQLADAVHGLMSGPAADRLKPRRYLQDAALKRMTPLQAWDASLYISVNRLPRPQFLTRFMSTLSTVFMHGAGWVVLALLMRLRDRDRGHHAVVELIPALVVTDTLVERAIKLYFRRRRPFITLVQALVVGRKPGSWSFPSGHSATSFACASVLGRRYPRPRPLFYSMASLVAFSRVYLGHHYPLDVASGATIGELLSRLVVWTVRRVRKR